LAQAQQSRLDHAGSAGLLVSAGPEYSYGIVAECLTCDRREPISELSLLLELGASLAVGDEGDEVLLRFRWIRLSGAIGEMAMLGYRNYFGRDEFKTFLELDLQGTFRPQLAFGVSLARGVISEWSPVFGVSSEAGASFGLGRGYRVGFEALVGIQGRSYLFE